MSVGARSETAPRRRGRGRQRADGRPRDPAGRLLARLSVLPTLLVMAWLLPGFLLLLTGRFTPVLALAGSVPVAVVLVVLGLRWIPAPSPQVWRVRAAEKAHTPWWAVARVVAVAVAFGADQAAYHSQFIIVMRDPASYFQFAQWISITGRCRSRRTVRRSAGRPAASWASAASPTTGRERRRPAVHGRAADGAGRRHVVGGAHAALLAAPALGAAALLAFGGLTARLVGPRWAPLAALVLAVSMPEQFTSRSNYSEPLAQILFLGGLCLVVDCLSRDGARGDRVIAAIAGLALGLTVLVRIDGASDILPWCPTAPCCCGRRRQALPLIGGAGVGAAFGIVDGLVFSRPYLATNKSSLELLAVATVLVLVVTLAALPVLWKRGLPQVKRRWLPNAASALTVLVVLAFAVRNHVQTVRGPASKSLIQSMTAYQKSNHLPIDPTRTYAEYSLHWVFWYIGVPVVILATVGAAILVRRTLRGHAPLWTLPLATFAWTIVTFLYRRRSRRTSRGPAAAWSPPCCPASSCWRCGRRRGWSAGSASTAWAGWPAAGPRWSWPPPCWSGRDPHVRPRRRAGRPGRLPAHRGRPRVHQHLLGELAAVDSLCAAIPANSSVVFVDGPAADRLLEVVRGMCGHRTARITPKHKSTIVGPVQQTVRSIERAGRQPVLLAAWPWELKPYGAAAKQVMTLKTDIDLSALMFVPRTTTPYSLDIYLSEPKP